MDAFRDWVVAGATAALALLTAAYVWATVIMARATKNLAHETRRQYDEANRPRIRLSFQYSREIVVTLVVENVGAEEALNVQLDTVPPLRGFSLEEYITDYPLFSEGAKSFPPSFKVEYDIGLYPEFLGEHAPPTTYDVRVSYEARDGRLFRHEVLLDLRFVLGSRAARQDPQESIAESLKKLANRFYAAKPPGSDAILVATPRDVQTDVSNSRRQRPFRERQGGAIPEDEELASKSGESDAEL